MMELISAERRALADLLASLTSEQWRSPSLCAGWSVAHVVAHLTMPFRITEADYLRGVQEAGGQFAAFSDGVAERDSALPQAELVAVLRDNVDNPWAPPGGGLAGALSHDVIHGLDIAWPLSIHHPIPDQALVAVLDLIVGSGERSVFDVPLAGIDLRATDLAWSHGSGAPLHGTGRELLLLVAKRSVPHELFSGDGVELLSPAR